MMQPMLLRLAYLGATNALAALRLLPMGDRDKDIEILTLRRQITVLERQLHGDKPQFTPADQAFLAALLHRLPRDVLGRIRLLVRPDTVLHWHRDRVATAAPTAAWVTQARTSPYRPPLPARRPTHHGPTDSTPTRRDDIMISFAIFGGTPCPTSSSGT